MTRFQKIIAETQRAVRESGYAVFMAEAIDKGESYSRAMTAYRVVRDVVWIAWQRLCCLSAQTTCAKTKSYQDETFPYANAEAAYED